MKFKPAPQIEKWLAGAPSFQWDAGNFTKSKAKHGFSSTDAESVFAGWLVFLGQVEGFAEDRYAVLGMTANGRNAFVAFTKRGSMVRVICCRAMRKKEREIYHGKVGN